MSNSNSQNYSQGNNNSYPVGNNNGNNNFSKEQYEYSFNLIPMNRSPEQTDGQ